MPRARRYRECLAHRWDCKRGGGSDYVSDRCAPLPKGGREPTVRFDLGAIFSKVPADVRAAQDAERAAAFAALTPAQRCAARDGRDDEVKALLAQGRAVRAETARFLAMS